MIAFTIPLTPITKKNSQQIIKLPDGRPCIVPSSQYRKYEREACKHLQPLGIDYPVNVKAIYYMPTLRKVDLTNLHSALHDILVAAGVLIDDNFRIIVSTDGSRVEHDKLRPRTEVEITEDPQQQTKLF